MMLRTLLSDHVLISLPDCACQFYLLIFFFSCSGSYRMLLTGCSVLWSFYSHLQPTAIFQPHGPLELLTASCGLWVAAFLAPILPYGPHFLVNILCCRRDWPPLFCDLKPIMKLACTDTTNSWDNFFYMHLFLFALGPFLLTLASYTHIISTIMRIPSVTRKQRAFLYLFLPSDSSQSVLWVSGHCLWISIRASEWNHWLLPFCIQCLHLPSTLLFTL